MHYSAGWSVHRDGDTRSTAILFERHPWWVAAIQAATHAVCTATRNWSCGYFCGPAMDLADRHVESFEVPASPETVSAWAEWRGLGRPFGVGDDGRQVPYADEYVRMP